MLVCKFNWYVHDVQAKGTFTKFNSPGQSLVETASPRHDYYKFRPKSISVVVELYFLAEFTCWQISARSSQSSFWISHLHYMTFYINLTLHYPMGSTLCQSLLVTMIGQIYFRVGWTYKTNSDWSNIFFTPPTPFKKIPPKVWQTPEHLICQQTGWVWDCGVGRRLIVCLLSSNFFTFPLQGFILPPTPLIIKQTFPSLKDKGPI